MGVNLFPLDGGSTRKAGDGGELPAINNLIVGNHPHPNLPPSRGKGFGNARLVVVQERAKFRYQRVDAL